MDFLIKMLPHDKEAIDECLRSDTDVEQGCFALCSVSEGKQRTSLLVKKVIKLTPDDFVIREIDRLSVSPQVMLRIAREAQRNGLAICMIHTHPMSDGYVDFSSADDWGNLKSFKFFHRMQPNMFHSCLVFGRGLQYVAGRVYETGDIWLPVVRVEVVGQPNELVTSGHGAEQSDYDADEIYIRNALLLGEDGQKKIHKKRIGIIGQGGLGASVSLNMVHAGFKGIGGVDFDVAESHSKPRIPSITQNDIETGIKKALINQRYAKNYDPEIEFIVLPTSVEDPAIASDLKDFDALVATTDDTRSRAFLNQFCQQHYIPLLDLGVEFAVEDKRQVVKELGKVNLVLPGTPCLQCSMHVHPERLRLESLPREMRDREIADGYIRGMDIKQPSMMMFNMEVAARGTQYLVAYFTGLFEIDPNQYERFSFLGSSRQPHTKPVKKVADSGCMFCSHNSEYLGAGDSLNMLFTTGHQGEGVEDYA